MANQQEIVEFVIDPKQALKAQADINSGFDKLEKNSAAANTRYQQSLENMGNAMGKVYDRQQQKVESYIKSLERQAVAAGKTGTEKLNAQMEQAIKNYGNSEQAINRITAAYEKLKKAQEGAGEKFNTKEFGEGIKNAIENPAQAAQGAIVGLLEKLGPLGTALGATVGVAVTAGATVLELSHEFGEWGISMRDAELRTGLSADALGKYTYAAKAAGTDVSIVERLMKGLTTAIEDTGKAGEKGRAVLREMGVDIQGVRDGTVSTDQVLQQISKSFEENKNTLLRNKDAMDLFKKAGIEAVPFLTELGENLKHAQDAGFGYKQSVVDAGVQTQKELADMGMRWDQLKLKIEGAAASVLTYFHNLASGPQKGQPDYFKARQDARKGITETLDVRSTPFLSGVGGAPMGWDTQSPSASNLAAYHSDMSSEAGLHYQLSLAEKAQSEAMKKEASTSPSSSDFSTVHSAFLKAEQDVTNLQAKLDALKKAKEEAAKIAKIHPFVGPVMGPEMEQYRTLQDMATATPRLKNPGNNLSDVQDQNKALTETWKEQEDAQKATLKYQEEMIKLTAGPDGELDAAKKIYDIRMKTATSVLEQYQAGLDYLHQTAEVQAKVDKQHQDGLDKTEKKQQEMLEKLNAEVAKTTAGLAETLITNPHNFGKTLSQTLTKKSAGSASEYFGQMVANVVVPGGAKSHDPVEVTDMNTQATQQNTYAIGLMTAHLAAQLGVQSPSIPATGSSPTMTMPSVMPGSDWSNVMSTASSQASAPATSNDISVPFFGGSSGGSGGGSGISIPSFSGGGLSIPSLVGGPGGTSGFSGRVGGSGGGGFNFGGLFGGLLGGGKSGGSSSGGLLGGLFKGGGFNMSSLYSRTSSPFASYGGNNGDTLPGSDSGASDWGTNAGGDAAGGSSGSFMGLSSSGVGGLAGAGLGMGSSMLLGRSLFGGKDVGTGMGILEGAGGGAMMGMQMAGPLGAVIGGAAGALAGLGEMLAGMESPQHKAWRLVKQIYGININHGMQNEIVQIAQNSYNNNVQEAVRSPQVRQMLGLYAAGTNQKSALLNGNMTPHAGSLVESGGQLQQQATYQYGQAYTFQSNLPTLGGVSSQTLPSPQTQGPQYVSLNIGNDSAGNFMSGQYVTPSNVAAQQTAAYNSGINRVGNSATLQQPGLITA